MTFSIVIPVYDQGEYLFDSIESALDQTVKAEVIVVNDGSADHSLEIAKRYPVEVIDQENQGLATARNVGIKKAKGDYILPLDADDILLENCIERMTEAAKETNADVITPSFKEFGVSNRELRYIAVPPLEAFKEANRIPYFSAFKKSVWKEVKGYNKNMTWGWEDYNYWIDVLKRGHSMCVIPEILVLYRTKEHSMIHVANEHAEELWTQMKINHPDFFV